ncbi:glutaredoxin family protein [Lacimicrobium alkaliphilum]|uniref:Thioredoxin family protein n=1 Tax=Lacimicrobium alkaliphilum TaxID=1526571 RepID=A0ABQ1R299_9ALTE|nr:glutaredoxin family protein [Lacimicrobium alkaliphilum]GGD52476.1 thioredoxin family protein [Lacimicrobium alkaliphilum]
MPNSIILYSTDGCHLCEQAEQMILTVRPDMTLKKIDIAYDDALYEQYRYHIPVLKNAASDELNWPFDTFTLKEFLS